jgi:hypothetical protein
VEKGDCSEAYVTLDALTLHQNNSSEKLSPIKPSQNNNSILLDNFSSERNNKIKSNKKDSR